MTHDTDLSTVDAPATPADGDARGDAMPSDLAALAEPLLRAHARQAGLPLALKDADSGVYRYVNDAMAALFGRPAAEVVGCTDAQLLSAPRAAALRAADQTALAQHPWPSEAAHRFEWRGGRHHWAALRIVMPDPARSGGRLIASVWTDRRQVDALTAEIAALRGQIEQEQRLFERLRREAAAVPVVPIGDDVPSTSLFEEHLRRELDLSSRERREFALLLIEIDPDPGGEDRPPRDAAAQAAVAEGVDRLVMANIRAMDASSRLSARRSAVLLSGVGAATAYTRGDGLRQQCAGYAVMNQGEATSFTVSVGVASFPHTAATRDALVNAAVDALARARTRGGNQARLAALPFPRPHGRRPS